MTMLHSDLCPVLRIAKLPTRYLPLWRPLPYAHVVSLRGKQQSTPSMYVAKAPEPVTLTGSTAETYQLTAASLLQYLCAIHGTALWPGRPALPSCPVMLRLSVVPGDTVSGSKLDLTRDSWTS